MCKYLIPQVVYKVADASKIEAGRRCCLRPAHGERAAGPAWIGGVALIAASTRHAHAPTRGGSRKEDRLGLGRFRRRSEERRVGKECRSRRQGGSYGNTGE